MDLSELEPAQISVRIKAARDLRGISQTELGDLFEADGLNKTDPGRIERMDPRVQFRRVHLDAIVRHLKVPERWITAEDVDEIVGTVASEQTLQEQVAELSDQLAKIAETLEQMELAAQNRALEAEQRFDEVAQAIDQIRSRRQQ